MKHALVLCLVAISFLSSAQDAGWSLQKCIDHAFQHNIQIKQSELGLDLAQEDLRQSYGRAIPSLNASASHGYNWGQTIDPFTNTFATNRIQSNSFGFNSSITLWNGLQTYNTILQSQINMEARQYDIEAMQNDVILNVAAAYLNVLFNQEFLKIAESNRLSTSLQADRISKLVNAGALPKGNLSEIQAQLASDEASLINAQNNLDIAYLGLTQLLQIPYEESGDFRIKTPDTSAFGNSDIISGPDAAISYALNNFPQIKSAEANLEAARVGVKVAKGGISPRLSASYSYGTGYSGANLTGIGTPESVSFPIGTVAGTEFLVLSLPQDSYLDYETKPFGDQLNANINQSLFFSLQVPIFNGFFTYSNMKRAEINLLSAEYNLERSQQQLQQSVEQAYANALAAVRSIQAAELATEAAQTAFDYAKFRFEQGVINFVDYDVSRIRLDNMKAEGLRIKYDYLFKLKILEFYQGKTLTLN